MNFSASTETLYGALALAAFAALISLSGFLGKSIFEYVRTLREDRRLYRTAVTRFYNDVQIWQKDFRVNYDEAAFDRFAEMIVTGGDDFKFAMPSADASDYAEIMKFIHWMSAREARIIRTFIVYSELLTSLAGTLSHDIEKFNKERKLRALSTFKEVAELALKLSEQVIDVMRRNEFLFEEDTALNALLDDQKKCKDRANAFAQAHISRLPANQQAISDQSSGGSGPDIVDLQDFIKLAHKITSAYRNFKPAD